MLSMLYAVSLGLCGYPDKGRELPRKLDRWLQLFRTMRIGVPLLRSAYDMELARLRCLETGYWLPGAACAGARSSRPVPHCCKFWDGTGLPVLTGEQRWLELASCASLFCEC